MATGKLSITPTVKIAVPNQGKPAKDQINITQRNKLIARASRRSSSSSSLPTMEDILESSRAQKLELNLQKMGPFFKITATSLETKNELGRAEGVIRVWFDGKILHLDSIRLRRETLTLMDRSIFGVGLFIGAVAIRHGFDSGCAIAQLLAINDSDLYASKILQ